MLKTFRMLAAGPECLFWSRWPGIIESIIDMCYIIVKMTNINQCTQEVNMQVSVLEAKTNLSSLVKLIESGKEDQIVISRYGKPVVKMVICNDKPVSKRIGVAKGELKVPDDLDKYNDEIAELFGGEL